MKYTKQDYSNFSNSTPIKSRLNKLEKENTEMNEALNKTFELLSDILDGKIDIHRQTVKERIKKYIIANLKEIEK